MRQERLLSVGTDGGGYINLLCTNKDDLSHFEEVKFVGGGSTILERLRAALPWPLGSSASALQALSGSRSA